MKVNVEGQCHCGDVRVRLELTASPGSFGIRACDCTFCRMHGVAYVSDPRGCLTFTVSGQGELRRYRQGADLADMLFCSRCGILVGATYQEADALHGVANARLFDTPFGTEAVVSPRLLEPQGKTERWKQIWFGQVRIEDAIGAGDAGSGRSP